MLNNLSLRIILQQPPARVGFALQKGSGNNFECQQFQLSNGQDLTFTCSIAVKGDRNKDEMPKLSGPFVQGPANGKFIYIDIGTIAGQSDSVWSRRLKIPLSGIHWDYIDELTQHPEKVLETLVPGTGRDGGPNCATVKPFDGWKIV